MLWKRNLRSKAFGIFVNVGGKQSTHGSAETLLARTPQVWSVASGLSLSLNVSVLNAQIFCAGSTADGARKSVARCKRFVLSICDNEEFVNITRVESNPIRIARFRGQQSQTINVCEASYTFAISVALVVRIRLPPLSASGRASWNIPRYPSKLH